MKKKFNKKEFILWAKRSRKIIERVAKEREYNEKSANFAFEYLPDLKQLSKIFSI